LVYISTKLNEILKSYTNSDFIKITSEQHNNFMKHYNSTELFSLTFLLKTNYLIIQIILYFFAVLFVINFITVNIKINFFRKIIHIINNVGFLVISIFFIFKMIINVKINNNFSMSEISTSLETIQTNLYLNYFSSTFGDAILVLAFLIGIICVDLLGSKNIFFNISNKSIFYLFMTLVLIMTNTKDLLILFISFEFIFLPTIYFVYQTGYAKEIDEANVKLFYWTLFGSFLILNLLAYLHSRYNTLDILVLNTFTYSKRELTLLVITFIIGFGIKVPIVPFHHWLLRVHVQSPTAFSIFLSGFLVKSAIYCLFMFLSIFNFKSINAVSVILMIMALILSGFGLFNSGDIKKLIAWATIQEMTFILLFMLLKNFTMQSVTIIFVVFHGILSAYMFYIVDIIQRRFKTRNLSLLCGIGTINPKLHFYLWLMILLFAGFPLTIKFYIELAFVALAIENNFFFTVFLILAINLIATIFFIREIIHLLYGELKLKTNEINIKNIMELYYLKQAEVLKYYKENNITEFMPISKKEYTLLNYLIFLMIFLYFFALYIY